MPTTVSTGYYVAHTSWTQHQQREGNVRPVGNRGIHRRKTLGNRATATTDAGAPLRPQAQARSDAGGAGAGRITDAVGNPKCPHPHDALVADEPEKNNPKH